MDKETLKKIKTPGKSSNVIYTISSTERRKDFFEMVSLTSANVMYPDMKEENHSHDYYWLLCFQKGKGTMIIDFEEHHLSEGDIVFISPGQLHKMGELENYEGGCIAFSEDFLANMSATVRNLIKHRIFSSQSGASICHVGHEAIKALYDDYQRLKSRFESPAEESLQKEYLASLLSIFLFDVLEYGRWDATTCNTTDRQEYQVYLEFLECVEQNFKTVHSTKGYVDMMSVSLSTLNKYVTNVSGKTPARIISERIALEAKRILFERPEVRIKEITYHLGFEDNSNFVKFFKRYVGMSPIEFKESL